LVLNIWKRQEQPTEVLTLRQVPQSSKPNQQKHQKRRTIFIKLMHQKVYVIIKIAPHPSADFSKDVV